MSMANVLPIVEPDQATMLDHVEHLFGGFLDGYQDGLIELAWTDSAPNGSGKYPLRHANLFATDRIPEMVARAAELNRTPGVNVYVGAWLRHPNTAPFGRSEDPDAWALTAAYVDLDEPGAIPKARDTYGQHKPTWVTVTGREPHQRAQLWWRLEEPITDHERGRALALGMAQALGGDETVVNPGRVMRLAGSVAWPQKPGRVLEPTMRAALVKPGLPVYMTGHLESLFPTIRGVSAPVTINTNSLGLKDKLTDGRERYMRDTVLACLIQYVGENGAEPTPQELFDIVWPQYERGVDFKRAGRGPEEVVDKCKSTIRRFADGKIPGVKDLDAAVAIWRQKQRARAAAPPEHPHPEGKLALSSAEFVAGFVPPDYLIDGILQRRFLYSLTAATGTGKTAVALLLLSLVDQGKPLGGKDVARGHTLYFAGENPDDVRMRWLATCQQMALEPEDMNTHFVPGVFKFSEITERIKTEMSEREVAFVVVDTSAAYSEAEDENSNTQMGAHARRMRGLIQLKGAPTVLVLCHPAKNATEDNLTPRGGSAFLAEVDGNLVCRKDDGVVELHWQGKFRGPEFNPLWFELDTVTHPRLKDTRGRNVPTVIARPLTDEGRKELSKNSRLDENLVLQSIEASPRLTERERAIELGWLRASGEPYHQRVQRAQNTLKKGGFIGKQRWGWSLTEKGENELSRVQNERISEGGLKP